MIVVYTVGYEKRTLTQFLEELRANGVAVLIDVREIAHSRKKGFAKTALRTGLEDAGIAYLHFKELGSPKELRNKYRRDGDFPSFARAYQSSVIHRKGALPRLREAINGKKCCLLCYEDDPARCHRSIVAAEVARTNEKETRIKHL